MTNTPLVAEVYRRAMLIRDWLVNDCGQEVSRERFENIYQWNHAIYLMQLEEENEYAARG